ncbi:hypothetical protein SCREM2_gp93 [Synechococcus phage S-CREM2]|nr:hypothetical protein SCREM2_gp93 [Synechococcus phage S-CREM2]
MFTWNVTLHQNGRRLDEKLQASTQREALLFAEARFPGYRATNAQRA